LPSQSPSAHAQTDVSPELDKIRASYLLPGLSALAMKSGKVLAQGAAGVRRNGDPTPLGVDDPINIASCTKWMTATLAGRLVDRGLISWETRVCDCFPEAGTFNGAFREATLDQILAHRAGIQESKTFEQKNLPAIQAQPGSVSALRRRVSDAVLRDPPDVPPGQFLYANQGYVVAATMMELMTGKDWESLMREEVFGPLKMNGATFGQVWNDDPPARAPVGHRLQNGATIPVPWPLLPQKYRNSLQASAGPGGYVVCAFRDWLKFLRVHDGEGPAGYLSPPTEAHLCEPFREVGYGRGVNVVDRRWATPGRALNHSGDIFGQDTVLWMAPARRLIVLAYANCRRGDGLTAKALDEAVGLLIRRYADAP
jgi:CubicO group peptidase (beta-lactamase class C family)